MTEAERAAIVAQLEAAGVSAEVIRAALPVVDPAAERQGFYDRLRREVREELDAKNEAQRSALERLQRMGGDR